MINDALIWLLLVPVMGAIAVWWFTGHKTEHLVPAGIYVAVSCVVVAVAFFVSKGAATSDVEIWNGQVISKVREQGHYLRSYDCRCREECRGSGSSRSCSQRCDTCYEDRYTNYVQAVPQSLFTPASADLKTRFANLIPPYPDKVYDFYRIDRFLTPGHTSPDAAAWNAGINELLKERGPRKQVNAIVVIAKTNDRNYVHALRDAWEGANKNDVVLVIGSVQWPQIDFVEVVSWTKNELFKTQLRDRVLDLGTIQREPILAVMASQIDTNFERRRMREFEYLQAEIDPPTWLLLTLLVLLIGAVPVQIYIYNGQRWTPRPTTLRFTRLPRRP